MVQACVTEREIERDREVHTTLCRSVMAAGLRNSREKWWRPVSEREREREVHTTSWRSVMAPRLKGEVVEACVSVSERERDRERGRYTPHHGDL